MKLDTNKAVKSLKYNSVNVPLIGYRCVIETDPGATVTATYGSETVTVMADGLGKANLDLRGGKWTIRASKDGLTGPATIYTAPSVFILPVVAVANTAPTSGVTYKEGLEGVTPQLMRVYGEAISNNNSIDDTTDAVWLDCGAESRKISIGDTMPLSINGSDWAVQVISFNTDDMADQSEYRSTTTGKCGMTLDTVLSIADARMNPSGTASGGWANTEMRNTTIPEMLATIPTEWQEVMLTRKLANRMGTSPTLDKLALHDLKGAAFDTVTTSYRFYRNGGDSVRKKKNATGNIVYWWLRDAYSSTYFWLVTISGKSNWGDPSTRMYGVVPSFAF
mgnify:CR=1 FL=1